MLALYSMLVYTYMETSCTKDSALEPEQVQMATQDSAEVSADSGALQDVKNEKGKDKEEKDKEKTKDPEKEKGKEKDAERRGEIEKEKLKGIEGTNLDGLLQRLPGCVSRDLIDQLTVSNHTYSCSSSDILEHLSY